ncbi:MobA/MobL family protein [Rhodanobacter sp. Col0626]|uniref:MobA/MobL family protein n=1 Tax=Rhodanobacter sp. Col0626 TaxID=3415679 RepID=UPI003CF90FE0
MASFHHRIKSGRKGSAQAHVAYIAREGKHATREDLMATGVGNMPDWAEEHPNLFWHLADLHERSNAAAFREHVVALPNELTAPQQVELVHSLLPALVGPKPHRWAIHVPQSSLGNVVNAHAHIVYSDRVADGIYRPPEQIFRRYNRVRPEKGGLRKESGGMTPLEVRAKMKAMRKQCADIQNRLLAKYGHWARVDAGSLKEQGINRMPERHLGQARVRKMSAKDKKAYVEARRAGQQSIDVDF